MKILRLFAVSFLVFLLAACGFHLKGSQYALTSPLPYTKWSIVDAGALQENLSDTLQRQEGIQVVENADDQTARLMILSIKSQKDIQNLNRIGTVNEYILVLRVDAEVRYQDKSLGAPFTITSERVLSYNDNEILGKQEEENQLLEDMYQDVSEQIVRRLSYLKPAVVQP